MGRTQQGRTYPSTAGLRSGRLLPLDLYLLWVCRRGGRLGPQCSPPPPKEPPRFPLRPPGTEPPNGPPPRPSPPAPPGTRGSESGLSKSTVNGRSTKRSCQSYGREMWKKKMPYYLKKKQNLLRCENDAIGNCNGDKWGDKTKTTLLSLLKVQPRWRNVLQEKGMNWTQNWLQKCSSGKGIQAQSLQSSESYSESSIHIFKHSEPGNA